MPVQTMLVTGTSKGLGRGVANAFLERNWRVIGCSRSEIDLVHHNYRHFLLDVKQEKDVCAMFNQIRREFKSLTALVNCAGMGRMNPALLTPLDTARDITDTNLLGTFTCCREAAKLMLKNKYGRIVNLSSIAVPLALPGEAIYGASKAAVEHLTRTLARELGGYGITVNCVGPNPVRTNMIANVPEDILEKLVARQAVKRFGEIRDVVNAVDFFLKKESDLVTGQILYLGGPP